MSFLKTPSNELVDHIPAEFELNNNQIMPVLDFSNFVENINTSTGTAPIEGGGPGPHDEP